MKKEEGRYAVAETPHAWIYYKDSGGSGVPILMLHGNAQTHRIFEFYEKKLSEKYRVLLMDSRAHGQSKLRGAEKKREFTITDMAEDVAAFLDVLQIQNCILLGFSDGANIALEFASLFPEKTASVIAISGNSSPEGLIFPVRSVSILKYQFFKLMNRFLKHGFIRYQQRASLLCNSPMMSSEQLQRIKAPVLLIAGTWDVVKVSHSREMMHRIPHARLILIKRGTHMSMFGQKQLYLKIIQSFLDSKDRRGNTMV